MAPGTLRRGAWIIAALCTAQPCSSTAAPAGATECGDLKRLVILDPVLREVLIEGCRGSLTLGRLIETIETSEWLIYVQAGSCPAKEATACLLHSVGRYRGSPYLRILVRHLGYPADTVASRLAHELQHANEVIQTGRVPDALGLSQLFKEIGFERVRTNAGTVYETREALDVEARVERELRARR